MYNIRRIHERLETCNIGHRKRDNVLGSLRVFKLLPWTVLHNTQEFQLDALFDCFVGIVRTDGVVVDPLLLAAATRKIREMTKEFDGRV
jgi:hypothetical protein